MCGRASDPLPEPAPDEDRHVMDKDGRWWRKGPDGVLEEGFRRSPNTPPPHPKAWVIGYARHFLVLIIIGTPFLIVLGIGSLLTMVAGESVPFMGSVDRVRGVLFRDIPLWSAAWLVLSAASPYSRPAFRARIVKSTGWPQRVCWWLHTFRAETTSSATIAPS
jgi:hypothetical protein